MLEERLPAARSSTASGANGNWELSMIEAADRHRRLPRRQGDLRQGGRHVAQARARVHLPRVRRRRSRCSRAARRTRTSSSLLAGPVHVRRRPRARRPAATSATPSAAFAATINAAETARQQGVDLYAAEAKRLRAALEFHAAVPRRRAGRRPGCAGGKLDYRLYPPGRSATTTTPTAWAPSLPDTRSRRRARSAPTRRQPPHGLGDPDPRRGGRGGPRPIGAGQRGWLHPVPASRAKMQTGPNSAPGSAPVTSRDDGDPEDDQAGTHGARCTDQG